MPSPQRLRRSPARQALHERTESQTNERGSPTLRLVEHAESVVPDVGPYPTKPSQILRPSGQQDAPFGQFRSDSSSTYVQEFEPSKDAGYIDRGYSNEDEGGAFGSSTDISYSTGFGSQSTIFTTPMTDLGGSSSTLYPSASSIDPSVRGLSTSEQSAVSHDEPYHVSARDGRQPANKDSDNSLSSTNTTGTVIVKKKRVSYSAFPYTTRPSSSKSNLSSPTSQKSSPIVPQGLPASQESSSPPVPSSPVSPPKERRTSSAPVAGDFHNSQSTISQLQYPVVRPPSASGSWAYSSTQAPPVPAKAAERSQQRWNPHLSTVPSEGADSLSLARSSGLTPDSARASQSSSKLPGRDNGDGFPSDLGRNLPESKTASKPSFVTSLMPNAPTDLVASPGVRNRDFSGSTIRVVEGDAESQKMKIPPTIPGSRDSAQAVPDIEPRTIPDPVTRPSSTASFFRDSIPAWAKTYYNRPNSPMAFSNRNSVNAEGAGMPVWQPRTRDRQRPDDRDRRRSGLAMHPTRPEDLVLSDGRGLARRPISPAMSAHLWRDRASVYQRRSVFIAPSIDEAAEGSAPTKRNVQVFAFALGFVMPFCWFIAAFLPLPPKPPPTSPSPKGKNAQRNSDFAAYLEKQLDPTDLARYENARWWRNINRMMCVVGVTVIILIIAVAAASLA